RHTRSYGDWSSDVCSSDLVPRIFKRIRPAFRYERSLDVLRAARDTGLITKSNLILGMGEQPDEVIAAMADLHAAGCELLTLTQRSEERRVGKECIARRARE